MGKRHIFKAMARSVDEINFEEAVRKGELWKYLGGYPEYAITNIYADLPTDMDGAMTPILRRAGSDPSLRAEFAASLIRLAEDPEYGWITLYYLQNIESLNQLSGTDWLANGLIESIAERLRKNKDAYIALKKWQGERFENGVWRLVVGANALLHDKHNITVLPEEL
jgi:hypothetical protein